MLQTTRAPTRPAVPARILIFDAERSAARALAETVLGLGHVVCGTVWPGPPTALPPDARPDLALVGLGRDQADAEETIAVAERVAERFGAPILYVAEDLGGALLDRAQRTMPHGYLPRPVDPRQLGLNILAVTGVAARERTERDRIGRSIAAPKAKAADVELHERLQVLNAIIRSMSDGVVVADVRGELVLANPSAKRMLGAGLPDSARTERPSVQGLFRKDATTPLAPDERPLVQALRGRTVAEQEIFVRNPMVPEGAYVSANANPLRDADGRLSGGVAVYRDITQQRLTRAALTRAFASGRVEILDTILHNIGNAINSVAVGVDTLWARFESNALVRRFNLLAELAQQHEDDWLPWLHDDPQGRQVRPLIVALVADLTRENEAQRKTAERVRGRVRHIVDIIRAQALDTAVERTQVVLRQAIDDAIGVVAESLKRRGIEVEVDCTRAPERIRVQENGFRQMLVHLVRNAMESIDELFARGRAPERSPSVCVRAARRQDSLVIDVIDNGIGITGAQIDRMFTAGYTTKTHGSGLGLHAAANYVIGSGGSIQPISEGIGRGATMRVTMRLAGEGRPGGPDGDQ